MTISENIAGTGGISAQGGGTLTVTTYCQPEQDIIDIDFTDTGVGISAAKIDKICAPFFTTKTKGTGLGLALVAKIIGDHGGIVECESHPRRTTFRVLMPMFTPRDGRSDARAGLGLVGV